MGIAEISSYVTIFMVPFAIGTFIYAVIEGKKATAEYKKANTEYKEAMIKSKSVDELIDEYAKLVAEYKGRILSWADTVNELAKQIETEEEQICMAMDTLSYGIFSAPEAYKQFWVNLLTKAASEMPIEIITFNDQAQEQLFEEQYGRKREGSSSDEINKGVQNHHACIKTLIEQGQNTVNIAYAPYFSMHLFIFKANKVALFTIQEFHEDGKVDSHTIKTQDDKLIKICRESFRKMQKISASDVK
ncbi:MAG: hypothetical protein ABUK01_15525 [Leptospirales bacterium]